MNAYSGNNGPGVILWNGAFYVTGNAGNGSVKGLPQIVDNTGVQILQIFGGSDSTIIGQLQGTVGASKGFRYGYSVTQYEYPADTSGKDDNFRGIAIFNGDGTVTIYAVTSTVSGSEDQRADPNQLVVITDKLSAANATEAAREKFKVLRTAESGTVLRGVSFAPVGLPFFTHF